jgi:hypothetical protein
MAMKALAFASFLSGIVWTVLINDGLAQPTATTVKPQVYSISGNTVILPRQAGSKDAPDITFSVSPSGGQNDRPQGGTPDALSPADVPANRRQR